MQRSQTAWVFVRDVRSFSRCAALWLVVELLMTSAAATVYADILPQPDTLFFQGTKIGFARTESVTITDTSTSPVTIVGVRVVPVISSAGEFVFQPTISFPFTFDVGKPVQMLVQFVPVQFGYR